jgi:hypothetical protein
MRKGHPKRMAFLLLLSLSIALSIAVVSSGQESTEDDPTALAEKQAIEARELLLIEAGRLNPAPVPDNPAAAGPDGPPPEWPEGIFGKEEADFPPSLGYEFQNIWRQVIGGQYVVVLAGARIDAPTAGVVMVEVIDPKTWGHKFAVYDTPVPGPVRISAVRGTRLTLNSDASGASVTFNVISRSFE